MPQPPNVILILTDNQQAATLGCYGNPEIHTPNIDALPARGVTFDNAFCPNAFCSPCRASVLTGKLPSQHGVHSWIDDRRSHEWPADWHALDGLDTLPKALKEHGYATALVGKYHLGQPTCPAERFDHWVTLEDGHVRSFYRNKIFDNGTAYDQPGHAVDFFTDKGIAFIEEQTAAATLPSNMHRAAHQIPMIMYQPGVTEPGLRPGRMVSGLDVFATILDHAGVSAPGPDVPSRSLTALLSGSDPGDWGPDAVFSEQEETRVIRTPKWACFKRLDPEKTGFQDELYDVERDPGETRNLAEDPAFAGISSALEGQLIACFDTYAEPQADLW